METDLFEFSKRKSLRDLETPIPSQILSSEKKLRINEEKKKRTL